MRFYVEKHIAFIFIFFCIFEIADFLDFSILGPGTMLIASGPEFCEERRIRYVRCSYFDPVREKNNLEKISIT